MKKIFFLLFVTVFIVSHIIAQVLLTTMPSGGNKKAAVSERIGLTDVTIHYDRPGVKGREGKIWGELIPKGFTDPGFGSSKSAPWRAGSNQNTTIEFSNNVKVEGQPLAAGKYGFFIAYGPEESTLIFSSNSTSWGHYYYNDKEDVLRVKVKPVKLDQSVEWLKYEFMNETNNTAVVALEWEKLKIPFTIEVDYLKDQVESFRRELRNSNGFIWESWNQAAQWCVQNNTNLDEALLWADSATSVTFGGDNSFVAATTKAQVLEKLGRGDEATETMKKAYPLASEMELHQYGRRLLAQKKTQEAFDVFKKNFDKNPTHFTPLVGLTRGYSAMGDYKKALKYATMALPLAPDTQNKTSVEGMIQKLKEGKDVNQ
ncbi:MAG: DUF2911 domain-containing protein [Agriterribacter sp.]